MRGIFVGTDEGCALIPEELDGCPHHFETEGHTWLDGIYLKEDPAGVTILSEQARKTINEFVRSRGRDGLPKFRTVEVLTGRLELPARFTYKRPNGVTALLGFGSGQALPGQLVYDQIVDVQKLRTNEKDTALGR